MATTTTQQDTAQPLSHRLVICLGCGRAIGRGLLQHLRHTPPALDEQSVQDIEIRALRHQIGVLQSQLGDTRVRFNPADRVLLASLLHRLPRPDTILR